ncbi:unnamed protein product, partial [Ectocarpus fasciculatus]
EGRAVPPSTTRHHARSPTRGKATRREISLALRRLLVPGTHWVEATLLLSDEPSATGRAPARRRDQVRRRRRRRQRLWWWRYDNGSSRGPERFCRVHASVRQSPEPVQLRNGR